MRISLRLTQWRLFFWGVSLYGVFLSFMRFLSGVDQGVVVLLGLVGTFLGALVLSLKAYGGHLAPQYLESLKAMREVAQQVKDLAEKHPLDAGLSHVVKAQTITARAERKFGGVAATVRIDDSLKRSVANFLFLAKTWASISLANDAERARIIFDEVLLDPAKHSYLCTVFGRARRPEIVPLVRPDTWVQPIARGAEALTRDIGKRLPFVGPKSLNGGSDTGV
jgi:hypothetical protein